MSDSFADLWSSSAPLPPKAKPQTLSTASASSSSRPYNNSSASGRPDAFTLLSSSGTSTPTSRYGTTASSSSSSTTTSSSSNLNVNRTTLTPRPSNPPSRSITPSTSSTGTTSDAFSDLFSSSSTAATRTSNMTLAARVALEGEQQRLRGAATSSVNIQKTSNPNVGNDAAWAGLDSFALGGAGSMSSGSMLAPKPSVVSNTPSRVNQEDGEEEDDWGLGDFGKSKPASSANTARASAPRQPQPQPHSRTQTPATTTEKKKGGSLWDLEEFSSGVNTSTSSSSTTAPAPTTTTSSQNKHTAPSNNLFEADEHIDSPNVDFDFGSREDRTDSRQSRKAVQRGLLDLDDDGDEDHGYRQPKDEKRGMHRGLLDDDGEDDGHGYGSTARGGGHDEDDILGMLGKPVQASTTRVENGADGTSTRRTRSNQTDNDASQTSKPNRTTTRTTASPPPHLLGQIVEMGFSVNEAKKALAATKDGQDVQAALESLLGGGSGDGSQPSPPSSQAAPPPAPPSHPTRTRGAPKGQKERERERLERQRLQQQQQQQQGGSSEGAGIPSSVAEMQEHADRLLLQASEIGSSMFSKASAFWKEGKGRVVKAYEERTGEQRSAGAGAGTGRGRGSESGGGAGGGRPRWMQEVVHASDDEDGDHERMTSRFRSFEDEREHQQPSSQPQHNPAPPRRTAEPKAPPEEVDLFAVDDEPQRYRRPSPQPKPRTQPIRQTSSSSSIRSSPAQTQPSSLRTAAPTPTRTLITASPSALSLAQKHKSAGTQQFKLGQHGPAAESYSSAINALPEGHLLLVPLFTNRALTRLRTGEYAGAIGDCERAVEGIFGRRVFFNDGNGNTSSSYGIEDPLAEAHSKPSSSSTSTSTSTVPPPMIQDSSIPSDLVTAGRSRANGGGWSHPQGVGVDLLDSYVKALRRAAEAFEGREKWVEACAWWGVLSQAGEGSTWVDEKARKEAVVGGVRCRKMVDGKGSSMVTDTSNVMKPPASKQKQKARPTPTPKKSTEPSKALQALQSTNAQAEADDNAKYALKDSVDARLSSWKKGKETNIRALLASLETVLWEGASGVQGLKMGMADLVSAGQVKKGYMKAIGRVHPDKLNAGNSTLEQRMLANGVFAGLNEAWIAFQAGQK